MRLWGLVLGVSLLLVGAAARAEPFETPARAAILIEMATGQVLYAKNPDEQLPPASMSKLMTALMVFERLDAGTLALDDTFPVSERAWRMGGSKMFVHVGDRVRVEDLLRGIIIQSGNDACIVVAEGLAGSEAVFAEQMTRRGQELGLTGSAFKNASGWPDPEHLTTVRDLAQIALTIVRDHPDHYHFYSEPEFTYADIKQYNRNPLLQARIPGVDGLKTGHTDEAGYGLVASAERDGRRIVMVVAGLKSSKQRALEAERLLEHGFRAFELYRLFDADEVVADVQVFQGATPRVPLVAGAPAAVGLDRAARPSLNVKVVYDEPLRAPVAAGTRVGQLEITAAGIEPLTVSVLAGADVARAGFLGRISEAFGQFVRGWAS